MNHESDLNMPAVTKTRRGLVVFAANPYVLEASANTQEGTRRRTLSSSDGSQLMITSKEGEVISGAGFWQTQEVDKTQFVKLYVNGVKAFQDLSSPGTKMFEMLYLEVQKAIGRDRVYLALAALPPEARITKATFTRGVRELIDKKFIAPTELTSWFWVNPDYMWNGDRLAYVKQYRLKRDATSDQAWRERLESAGQLRLDATP